MYWKDCILIRKFFSEQKLFEIHPFWIDYNTLHSVCTILLPQGRPVIFSGKVNDCVANSPKLSRWWITQWILLDFDWYPSLNVVNQDRWKRFWAKLFSSKNCDASRMGLKESFYYWEGTGNKSESPLGFIKCSYRSLPSFYCRRFMNSNKTK